MLQRLGGVVVDADLPFQFQDRDTFLGLREQINRQEPLSQWQARAMEDGASGQRGLVVAG